MNNDINNNINFIGTKIKNHNTLPKIPMQQNQNKYEPDSTQNSLNFLGTLGCAQVNMDTTENKRIKEALEKFQSDPEKIKAHTKICDDLVKKGYTLEQAILTTDKIFDILSRKETYI